MADLQKEIWINQIMEAYQRDLGWMAELDDMSQFVDNNTINLAEAGVQPEVLINNTSYPVAYAERTDAPLQLPLDVFDTEGTVIRNARKVELAYDKMASVLKGHVNALQQKTGDRAAFAIAPTEDDDFTPVLPTSGAAVDSFKILTEADVLALAERFDLINAPEGSRVLLLHPTHYYQLLNASDTLKLQNQFSAPQGTISAKILELFGFKVMKFRNSVVYDKGTLEKAAWGAAAAPSTDTICSIAFVGSEVMRAVGSYEMFARLNDPEQKGDIINFQQRFVSMPKRNKYIGSLVSVAG